MFSSLLYTYLCIQWVASSTAKEALESKLCQIEQELAGSREELSSLKEELREKSERSEKEKVQLQQEREKSKSLLQVWYHNYYKRCVAFSESNAKKFLGQPEDNRPAKDRARIK